MGLKVGIIGITGYVGEELLRLLCRHPEVAEIRGAAGDHNKAAIDRIYPNLRGSAHLEVMGMEQTGELIEWADQIFLALPHGLSSPYAREAMAVGKRVVDLAADFRLPDPLLYQKWYQEPHGAPELLDQAVYGLPELFRPLIKKARLIANPGCYPTSALLALAPLLKAGLIAAGDIIIDSKSGVTGAGRALVPGSLFCECDESVKAYGVGTHRHTPEIAHYASLLAGTKVMVAFTPHLIPMTRGILSTIYVSLTERLSTGELRQLYRQFYEGEHFVHLCEEGEWPQTSWVKGSNHCFLGLAAGEGGRAVLVAVIDNLVKGAAGQAVQNMNLMWEIEETAGLQAPGIYF